MHPFLQDQENLRAFLQLTASPTGSVRKWEQLLGWKAGRMQRFLANAVKYGLAEVTSCPQHTTFRPLQTVADRSGSMCSVVPRNQEQGSGLTASRLQRSAVENRNGTPGAELLIATMNQGMKRFDSYLPVSADNYGSHRAAKHWLDTGIPLEEAIVLLRRKVAAFSLDKSGDEYPRGLGYFTKVMLVEWKRIQRDRQQLSLMPEVDMKLEVA